MHPISTSPIYVLLTGLEPFSDDTVNPAWEIARALEGWHHAGATVRAVQLLCVLDRAIERLVVALAKWQSKMVACLGLTGGRSEVSLERVAITINDDPVADNVDQQPEDLAEMADGSAAYFSTLPIKAIVRDLQFQWLPSIVFNTVGAFVCSHIFYALMHQLAHALGLQKTRGGFIHLPYLPEQEASHSGAPSIALATQSNAIRAARRRV